MSLLRGDDPLSVAFQISKTQKQFSQPYYLAYFFFRSAGGRPTMASLVASLEARGPTKHTQSPIVTGTSVVAVKYAGGVMMAADTLGSYGSLARFVDVRRIVPAGDFTLVGADGDMSDFQHLKKMLSEIEVREKCAGDGVVHTPSELFRFLASDLRVRCPPPLRRRCAAAAPPLRRRCAAAAPPPRRPRSRCPSACGAGPARLRAWPCSAAALRGAAASAAARRRPVGCQAAERAGAPVVRAARRTTTGPPPSHAAHRSPDHHALWKPPPCLPSRRPRPRPSWPRRAACNVPRTVPSR